MAYPVAYGKSACCVRGVAASVTVGIMEFCDQFDPHLLIGLPNDRYLERWYSRLSKRYVYANRLIEMRRTDYHTRQVLVVAKSAE
jgi:hypothetical protein